MAGAGGGAVGPVQACRTADGAVVTLDRQRETDPVNRELHYILSTTPTKAVLALNNKK